MVGAKFWGLNKQVLFSPKHECVRRGSEGTKLSYPGPRRRNRSLYTCAKDVQITHIVTT
jgi:hypothetical protein